MPYFIIILGTAGSGKTTLSASLQEYLSSHSLDSAIVNLDPAVEELPYKPDIDVREIVNAHDLMKKYGLGPNGALVAAADMLALKAEEISEEIWSLKTNYIILDTPGQMEIFAFRESGPIVLNTIVSTGKAVSLFLIDTLYAVSPSNFLSALLLAASTQVRIGFPQILVMTKTDLAEEWMLEEISKYMEEPEYLATAIMREKKGRILWDSEDVRVIAEKTLTHDTVFVSSTNMSGLDTLYAQIQRVVAGGEDYYTEEPSPIL